MATSSEQMTTQQDTQEAIQVNPSPALQAWSAIDEKGDCKEVSKEESDNVEKTDNVEVALKEVELKEVEDVNESDDSDDSDMCCEEDCECVLHLECPHCLVTLGLKKELSEFQCLVCGMTIELESESDSESESESDSDESEKEEKEEKSTVPSFVITAVKFLLYAYLVKFLLYIIDGGNTFQHTCHCVCEGGKFMSLP
jgi:nucleolin